MAETCIFHAQFSEINLNIFEFKKAELDFGKKLI